MIMRRFELEPLLANIEKFQINEIGLVPPIIIAIIMSGLASKYSLKGIKSLTCGAAPLGRESQDRMRDLLAPGTLVNQVWGMTETSCIASMFYCPEDDVTGSVGRMIPGLDVKYVLSLSQSDIFCFKFLLRHADVDQVPDDGNTNNNSESSMTMIKISQHTTSEASFVSEALQS